MKTNLSKVRLAFLLTLVAAAICCVSVAFAGFFGAKTSAAFADEAVADSAVEPTDNATFTYNGRTYEYSSSVVLNSTTSQNGGVTQSSKWLTAIKNGGIVLVVMDRDWIAAVSSSRASLGTTPTSVYSSSTSSTNFGLDRFGGIRVPGGCNIILDLNGHVIDRRLSESTDYSYGGPVITVEGGATLTIIDRSPAGTGVITGGYNTVMSGAGGGIFVSGNGTVNFDGGTLAGNYALDCGGGVYSNGAFTMSGGTIAGNSARNAGGGVYGTGTVTINGGTISGNNLRSTTANTAAGYGGGGVYSNGAFTMSGGTISNNTSGENFGGGVLARSTVNISGGTITGNTVTYTGSDKAFGKGGGVYSIGAFSMSGGDVSGNVLTSDEEAYGGGVYGVSTVTISGGSVTGNSIDGYYYSYGGGVYSSGAFTLSGNGVISNNFNESQSPSGGGVYAYAAATISGGTISNNKLESGDDRACGGGVYGNSTVNMTGGTIAENVAKESWDKASLGGGVYSTGTFTLNGGVVSRNQSSNGGGVYGYGTVYVYKGSVTGNTAFGFNNEGDLFCYGGGVYSAGAFTMSGGDISNNVATIGTVGRAGGVYGVNTVTISGGAVSGNNANYGGGIYSNGTFTLSGTASISGNTASQAGGGVRAGTTANINGGSVTNNKCTSTTAGTGYGGGGIASVGTFTMTQGDISRNTSSCYAGGVLVTGAATISGGSISGNTSTQGGGLYATGAIKISGKTSVSGNTANGYGGGVHGDSTVTLQDEVSICGNTLSGSNGGGVYSGGAFLMNALVTVSDNKCSDYGGGVCTKGTFNSSGTFSGNKATATNGYGGAVYINNSGKSFIYGDVIGNTAGYGGGVYITTGSLAVFARFISNTAEQTGGSKGGGLYFSGAALSIYSSDFRSNCSYVGGGVYLNNYSSIIIQNSVFKGNCAEAEGGYGGAVHITDRTTGAITVSGCDFIDNHACESEGIGGGLYIYSGQQPANASSDISVTDCNFKENHTYDYGGGLYIHSEYKSVSLTGCKFSENDIEMGNGCSAYINGVNETSAHTLTVTDCDFQTPNSTSNVEFIGFASATLNRVTVTDSRSGIIFTKCVNVTFADSVFARVADEAAVMFNSATSAYTLRVNNCVGYDCEHSVFDVSGTTNNVYFDGGSYTSRGDDSAISTRGELHIKGAIQLNMGRMNTSAYSASILVCDWLYEYGENDSEVSYASIAVDKTGIITKNFGANNSCRPSEIFHDCNGYGVWLLNNEVYVGNQPQLTWQRSTSNSWSSYSTTSAGAVSTTAAYTGYAWLARAYYSTTSNGYKTSVTYYKDGVGSAIAQSSVKNAGTYVARINDTTSEWANPELTIIITKKAITAITGGTVNSKVYDGTTRATVDLSGVGFTGKFSSDTLTLGYGAATYADANAGTGKTVTVTGLVLGGAAAANYTLNVSSFTISSGAITAYKTSVVWTDTTLVYTGTAQGPAAKYKDVNGTEQTLTLSGKVTATNAGSYSSMVTKPANYDFTNTSCTWKIIKADPKVTPVFTNETNLVVGMDMPTVETTSGDTAGTISWVTNRLTIGTNNYTWVFVPDDSNYNTVTGVKSFTVAPADGTTLTGIEVAFDQNTPLTTSSDIKNIASFGALTVEEVYSDGSKKSLAADKYTVTAPEGGLKAGSNVITVTHTVGEGEDERTFTKTFKVFVQQAAGAATLIGVSASFAQSGAILTTAELKNLTDFGKLTVEEVYSDGKKVAVTKNYKLSIGEDDKFVAGVNTVKVTYTVGEGENEKTFETTFTVYAQTTEKTVVVVVIEPATSIVGEELITDFKYSVLTGGATFEDGELEFETDADKFKAGAYEITGKYTGEEYDVKFVNGVYTVTANPEAKQVTVVIANATSVYGSAIATNFSYTVIGLDAGETLTGITLTKEEGTDAGEYAITGSYEGSNKYNVVFVNGVYTITPKTVTVVIDNKTTAEGTPITNLTYTVIGLGEDEELDGVVSLKSNADAQTPNEYAITGSYSGKNYAITWVEGKYTVVTGVAAGTVLVIVDNKTSVFGDALKELTFTVVDDVLTADDLRDDITLELDEKATSGDAGEYAIKCTYTGSDYTVKVVNGTYTVTPKIVKVLIDSKSSFKGAELVPLTSNAAPDFAVHIALSTTATGLTAGEFAITGTYDGSKNYDVQFINGVYTVKEVSSDVTLVVVVIDNLASVVGADIKQLTYTTIGLEEGEKLTGITLTSNADKNKVGVYAITGKYTGTGNYVVVFVDGVYTVKAEAVAEVKITAKQTGEIFANSTLDDVKSRLALTLSVDGEETELTDYTLTMNLADGTVDVTVTVDGEMHTETVAVFVTAKQMTRITAEYSQGDDRITPNTSKADIPVRVIAYYNDGTTAQIDRSNYILTGTLNVGPVTLVVTYSDGVKTFTSSVDVIVSPLEEGEVTDVTVDWSNVSFIYDGREHSPIATFAIGTYNAVLEIEITGENVTGGKAIKTGNYVAKVTAAAIAAALADGYNLTENLYKDFVIEEAELKIEWTNGTTVEFDGDEHSPVYNISANIDDGKIGYKFEIVPKAGSKLTADGKAVNAGEYVAKVVLTDSENYKVNGNLEFAFVISKSQISKIPSQSVDPAKEFENLTDAIAYVQGLYGDRKVTVTGAKNADGKFEVTVRLEDETNYVWTEGGTAAQSFKFASVVAPVSEPEDDGVSNILIIALIVALVVVAFVAFIAFIVAAKKPKSSNEDDGGFYESANA